jgi:GTP-binding protein Era
MLIERLKTRNIPAVLVINKIDTVPHERLLEVIGKYREAYDFADYIPVSALNCDGIDILLDSIGRFAAEGPPLFPEGQATDQPERQLVAELIREKLLYTLDKEVPHGIAVAIEVFEEEEDLVRIGATIYCERNSHKGIIIGKKGAMLKRIGMLAREDIERFFGTKVFLETWVKVKENWRKSDVQIRNFGFK